MEVDTEDIIQMKIIIEVEVNLKKDSIQKILEGMTDTIVVDLDQVQELVLIKTGSDVTNVENTMIFLKMVQHHN